MLAMTQTKPYALKRLASEKTPRRRKRLWGAWARGLVLAWLGGPLSAPAQGATSPAWTFLYEREGMRVYQGQSTASLFKAEGTLAVNFYELLAVVADVARRPEWVSDLQETKILPGGDGEHELITYERFSLPWPAEDRDVVVRSQIVKDYKSRALHVRYQQTQHPARPPQAGLVRMPRVEGQMDFRYADEGHTTGVYTIHLDVGGDLPQWLIDVFSTQVPGKTLSALVNQVKRTRLQYADFINQHKSLMEGPR